MENSSLMWLSYCCLLLTGVTMFSFIERKYVAKETGRVAPLSAYPLLTFCLMASSAMSNQALNYINFPTKVVFRSCKLIPTMVVASIVHRKIFSSAEYSCALAVCAGLVFFAAADWKFSPSFNPIGLTLVSLSVCADAILPNAQERLFRLGSSRLEVTFFTNLYTLIAMTCTTFISGDLIGILQFAAKDRRLALYMVIYTMVSYIAISAFHMNIVKRFGGVAAVVLATARKGMTLVLSFILFPKAFSWYYVMGASLVLGGLLISSIISHQSGGGESSGGLKRHGSERDVIAGANKLDFDKEPDEQQESSDDDIEKSMRLNLLSGEANGK
jgi:adenosine 3'-phospho 5'-phosphosulfate transporter B3